jgi:hypothetical protein
VVDKYLDEHHFSDKVIINTDETKLTITWTVADINLFLASTLVRLTPNQVSQIIFQERNFWFIVDATVLHSTQVVLSS